MSAPAPASTAPADDQLISTGVQIRQWHRDVLAELEESTGSKMAWHVRKALDLYLASWRPPVTSNEQATE